MTFACRILSPKLQGQLLTFASRNHCGFAVDIKRHVVEELAPRRKRGTATKSSSGPDGQAAIYLPDLERSFCGNAPLGAGKRRHGYYHGYYPATTPPPLLLDYRLRHLSLHDDHTPPYSTH